MMLVLITILPISFFTVWLALTLLVRFSFPALDSKRIGFLIAHPDDEAMFFSPAIIALTEPSLKNHVTILCLSSGHDERLKETRRRELAKSARILGLRSEEDVTVLDDPRFLDNMTLEWEPDDIASILSQHFAPSPPKLRPGDVSSAKAFFHDIDILITFDQQGISSHANHISLYHGALSWLAGLDPSGRAIAMYSLTTTSLVRKYMSLFDAPLSLLLAALHKLKSPSGDELPNHFLFVAGTSGYRKAQQAMTQGHASQMLWFRWGWIALSRYIGVNDLKRENPVAR